TPSRCAGRTAWPSPSPAAPWTGCGCCAGARAPRSRSDAVRTARMNTPTPAAPAQPVPTRGRRRRLLTALLGGVVLTGALGWLWYGRRTGPDPPPTPAEAAPEVRQAVEEARQAVLRAPRSGDAWGRLGMLLTAHDYFVQADACYVR